MVHGQVDQLCCRSVRWYTVRCIVFVVAQLKSAEASMHFFDSTYVCVLHRPHMHLPGHSDAYYLRTVTVVHGISQLLGHHTVSRAHILDQS
jgi:hypothetical protein